MAGGTEGGRGHLLEGLESSSGPSSSSLDQGLPHPTSPLQGRSVAGRADGETLPLPEEELNNRADTSGAAHFADSPMPARERTHPYLQLTLSTDSLFHTLNTETISANELPQTQTALKHETGSSSNTLLGTDTQTFTVTHPTLANSSIPEFTSSSPETTWESGTILNPRHGAVSGVPEEKPPPSWRNQRSADRLNFDMTSAVTSDPLTSPTEAQQEDSNSAKTDTKPTASSSLQGPSWINPSTTPITRLNTTSGTVEALLLHPNMSRNDSFVSTSSDTTSQTVAFESTSTLQNTEMLQTFTSSSTQSQTNSLKGTKNITRSPTPYTNSPFTETSKEDTQKLTERTQRPFVTEVEDWTLSFTASPSTPRAAPTLGDVGQTSAATVNNEAYTQSPTYTPVHDNSAANSQTSGPLLSSSTAARLSINSHSLQTITTFPGSLTFTHSPSTSPESDANAPYIDDKTTPVPSKTSTIKSTSPHRPHTQTHLPLPSSSDVPATHKQPNNYITTTHASLISHTTPKPADEHGGREVEEEEKDESWQRFPSSATTQTPTTGSARRLLPWTTSHPSQENQTERTTSGLNSLPTPSSTTSRTPKFYIVPDQPAAIRVESIELLLQIIVEESRSAFTSGLEEATAAWVEPYLQRAPGFSRLLGVWSSGHAVQSLVEFKTSEALQWLSMTGPASLLERTGLAQAVREGRSFRSSKITNITLGGVQTDVCDWLLQCPAGYKCVSQPGTSNYSCSSVCHFDYCHHHGICTHHPGQLPVCRCLVGEDFWYMGQRCDVRMSRARLVGACLAILLIMVTVIGVLAFVAVRRYKAALIQAKVDQTRSSYRRFNHFDELSGRFWLRSWAGSADSLDNPAFTRSDELLHLRALDRPCCYHDDTLSLASTCPSHGTRINTIYPHSSQYGWRGSEVSMGDGVLDSGKASDLSVCSWPVEPIQWTPFPLLQQLASHRTPTVRLSRPRSYCEGMELVDLGKSWTA
uniref:uncharacterized protein n=1 Tax=Semicossyphus pulcher TaxID=241346 RepID=UPI0037E71D32